MRKETWAIVGLMIAMTAITAWAAKAKVGPTRETVLDRKVHIEDKIQDAPKIAPLCDSISGLTKGKIDVGGCKLYCEQESKGTPLVLVSGGPGSTHHLFHPYFSMAAKYAKVIYYDQRGVGQSDQDATGKTYSVRQAVEDLDALRKALKIEKWFVLGHSYGGFLAQCYALEHPDRVLGLILVTSSPGTPSIALDNTRQYDYMSKEELARINAIAFDSKLTEETQVYNRHLNGDWKRQDFYRPTNDELARMALYEWKPGPGFRGRIHSQMERIDLKGRFVNFDIPTLIAEAKWDLTWNTDKPAKMLKSHPGAKLVMFERSGHSLFADEPDGFFAALGDFVKTAKAVPTPKADRLGMGVPWPAPVIDNISSLPLSGAGAQALAVFAEAQKENLTDIFSWLKLGLVLYDGRYYPQSLEAFGRMGTLAKNAAVDGFVALTWKGHLLDLMGRREEAIAAYKEALKIDIGTAFESYDQYDLVIDRKWAEERLKTPFERK